MRGTRKKFDNYADLRGAEEFRTESGVKQLAMIELLSSEADDLDISPSTNEIKLLHFTAFATDTFLEQRGSLCDRRLSELERATDSPPRDRAVYCGYRAAHREE